MDHHHYRHHNNHPNHHHQQPRQHYPQLIDSSSSRYLPFRPPPPPPSFPDDHPNLFPPQPQRHLPHPPPPPPQHHPLSPRLLLHHPPPPPPPSHSLSSHPHHKPYDDLNFVNSPPHHHNHHHHHHHNNNHLLQHRRILDDDHRDVFRSPTRVIPPNRVHIYDNHHHNFDEIDRRPRFRLSELPPPLPPPPPPPSSRVPPLSPEARRSPPQFVQFDRVRREIDSPTRFREELNLEPRVRVHPDAIEYQLRRDRVDDRRVLGVFDRLEGDFSRDHDRERGRDFDHHERYYPEMVTRKEIEPSSGVSECRRGPLNEEVLMRGGREDVVLEENVNMRRGSGGSIEVSRSPIKFRIGGIEVDDEVSDRGRKEEVLEYNNRGTPKKIVQKKSAFLRIQPGKQQQHNSSFRNRFDNNNKTPSPHKGKESNLEFLDRRLSEERVRSSVELDVSFKSNALVAKPIMTAPSCSGVDSNVNNSLNDSGIRIDGESSKADSLTNNTSVSKKEEKYIKNRVRVSAIMRRLSNPNNVEVRGNHSGSSPGGSSSLSGGVNCKAGLNGEVLGKDDKNAGFDDVSSPNVRKKRKAISPLSRLSRSVLTKTDSGLVNVDCSANHPSDVSMPSDVFVKHLEKELFCGGDVIDSTQSVFVDTDKIDVSKSPTVVDQEEVVGLSVSEASVSKRMREIGILEYLPDSLGSLGTEFSEGHGNTEGISQDEQRISKPNEDVTKSVEKHSSDIYTGKDRVKDQDMVPVLVNNGSEEGSSELVICVGDNVNNDDNCCGNVDTLDSAAIINSIPVPVSNKIENKVDLTCPLVGADKPCETQVISSPENATTELSLGGLYSDRDYEPESRYSEDYAKLGSFSIDVSSNNRTSLSCDDDITIGLKHIINSVSDARVSNDIQEQQCQGSETTLVTGDNPKSCIGAGGVLAFPVKEDTSLLNRKRKAKSEPDSLDSRISKSCHESAVSVSSPIDNDMLPVEKHNSAVLVPPFVKSDVLHGSEFAGSLVKGINSMNHPCDLDPAEHSPSCGKKMKIFPLEPVFSEAPGSESSDLPASAKNLITVADGPSAIYSPQLAEAFELQKSVIAGKDAVDGAASSLCAETCSFADNSISDFLDSCLSITKSAPPDAEHSYLPESGCNQKVDGNVMTAGANEKNGLIALESICGMATNDRKSNLQCPADHTGDAEQGSLAMNMDCDDTVAVITNPSSLSGCLQSCTESSGGVTTISDVLDTPSNFSFPGACSLFSSSLDTSISRPAIHATSSEKLSKDDNKLNQSFATQSSFTSQANFFPECHKNNSKSGISASLGVQSSAQKSASLPSKQVKTTTSSSNSMIRQRRDVLTRSEASPTSHRSSVVNPSNKTQTFPVKPRTWHRTSNSTAPNTPVNKPSVGIPPPVNKPPVRIPPSVNKPSVGIPPPVNKPPVRIPSSVNKPSVGVPPPVNKPPVRIPPSVNKPSFGIPPPYRALYGKGVKVQDTSYIRKGNSLVRNPVSGAATSGSHAFGASIDRSKPNKMDRIGKMVGSVIIESNELPDGLVTGGRSAPIEMPKTPPLPCSGKTSDNDVVYSEECTSSLHVHNTEGTNNEEGLKSSDVPLSSCRDPEIAVNRNSEDPGIMSDGDLLGSKSKKMIYVKRKLNQSALSTSKPSLPSMDNATTTSSDSNYYKRRKNQLIRASSDGNIQQMAAVNKESSKLRAFLVSSGRSFTRRQSNKVKSPKFSLVWKLGDSKSCGKGVDALRSGRLLSHLLPWKRAPYWSRKLLSSRKRGAVYVRSSRGFSLRRSKVISLPGTSLKWSKSMEKRSKKVGEEAALAVAAMGSVQKSGSEGVSSKAESSAHSLHGLKLHPGERIFRIGVFRYRMDPSRRTLQRISDEEASDFTASKTEKGTRKTYVPKRLLIGSDEYVRISNGNQLVRDPKRRTRILASEKVRWSLHTARMRLAKKRKFCQFFTRFGKCNKGEGKCPFTHDPSKIAVCTKFLKGLCADPNCNLTHEVIPERMPDCSFFLQGLCSNEKCPYRHVNVNPKASICESFLRGYCAEGNECRKKHSYICPEFEASGSCPQGSKCKLYHPKKGKAKKRKGLRDQKNAKGRYFGSGLSVVVDPETRPIMPEKHAEPNKVGSVVVQGELGDFVSLGVSDDEAQEDGPSSEHTILSLDGPLNSQLDDFDELIKPLRLLGRL